MTGSRRSRKSAGFTLIEALVTIGIIGVLAGLALPAVQAAREASRRARCSNNMRQLGIAIHSYLSVFDCFPTTNSTRIDSRLPFQYFGAYSIHVRMLPQLEQNALFNAVNFETGCVPPQTLGIPGGYPQGLGLEAGLAANSTASSTSIGVLLCPSDPTPLGAVACSYRGNTGVGSDTHTFPEYPDSGNGIFPEGEFVTPASVPDGLSATAAFGERLTGSGAYGRPMPERDVFTLSGYPGNADGLIRACGAAAHTNNTSFVYSGHSWFWSGRERTLYNHSQPPNGSVPDCLHPSEITATGMSTARSMHPGGALAGMADGSVRFVKETVSAPVWRATGTRNGGESLSVE